MRSFGAKLIACAMCVAAVCALPQVAGAIEATDGSGLSLTIPVVTTPPAIDGTLGSTVWQQGAKVHLGYDRLSHSPGSEDTIAYLLTDGKALYVAFDAKQTRTAILANQHSNNAGVDLDDEVKVALWPGGSNGFNYQFISTPIGTRYQMSSENLAYEPTWQATGKIGQNEWFVTMRIPLSIMRGANQKEWLIQLTRYEPTTGSLYGWSGGANWNGTTDVNYARPMRGMPVLAAVRPQPRIAVYGLGATAAQAAGGATSRTGVDLSIPITQTSSFIATIHPDFSNAESDQQSISPTAFRRFYNETRPFFTQGANFYNYMECDACPNEFSLYTPAIPTPRNGYAVEGTQGRFTFGGFDAVGVQRNDSAQSVIFKTRPRNFWVSAQRVAVDMPALHDNTLQLATKWSDLTHHFIYANYGTESGTLVSDPRKAKFAEIGGGIFGANSFTGGGIRRIGAQFSPYDGFFSNNDIAGYGLYSQHTWTPTGSAIKQIDANVFFDRYHGAPGLNQSDNQVAIDFITRKLWRLSVQSGSSYLWVNDPNGAGGVFAPTTQNETALTYHYGSSTPTTFAYARGRFGSGRLDSFSRSTTIKFGPRGSLSFEANNTRQYMDNGQLNVQWLERASFAYQSDANTSLAFGVRRIFGSAPTVNGVPQRSCADTIFCTNLSLAFHRRLPHDELYIIYGDASTQKTVPMFLMKLIHYFGAEKGT
ncbi:MAG: DUF5916 domain-containing protein [Candidatus Eremiobacteraeota bacterium]|nr:DUF5916 domain-containing protein [Candidatus Eremiobacteraeota bacterium]